jgi:hypothetical protein
LPSAKKEGQVIHRAFSGVGLTEEKSFQTGLDPRMSRSRMAITAITNKTWMMPPAENTKNPRAQPINKITAIRYNMIQGFNSLIRESILPYHNCRYNANVPAGKRKIKNGSKRGRFPTT